jgi:Mg2+/Co2+ transporter CorB
VRGIIEHHLEEGNVFKSDGDMLGGVLDIGSMTISEIMIHRSHMISIDASLPTEEITSQALLSPHTRIPLWKDSKDNIVGILHIKDLLRALYKNQFDYTKITIDHFVSSPWFIPEHALVRDQLHSFRKKRSHLAIVIDEYGDMLGIVSLEDILEEIVGQIDDEHDNVRERIVKKGNNKYIIDGSTPIRDLNRELGWNLPDENASTIAGLVMHEAKKLPDQGEIFMMFDLRITVRKKLSNRIKTLSIELLETSEEN